MCMLLLHNHYYVIFILLFLVSQLILITTTNSIYLTSQSLIWLLSHFSLPFKYTTILSQFILFITYILYFILILLYSLIFMFLYNNQAVCNCSHPLLYHIPPVYEHN